VRQAHPARSFGGPGLGLLGVVVLLTGLAQTGPLEPQAWAAGLGCGLGGCLLLARGLVRGRRDRLTVADRVTLGRLVLSCGVVALTVQALTGESRLAVVVAMAGTALLLDGVDGRVARLTGSVTALGARFDMETDALLVLALSIYVADATGWWVLAIGLARYGLLAAAGIWPWLGGPAPRRRSWCKVVAVTQGVVLIAVAAGVLATLVETALLLTSLGLLAESFGREVWQRWCLHRASSRRPARRVRLEPVATDRRTVATLVGGLGDA
jgi:phosphatidylglycerophosphate synthase